MTVDFIPAPDNKMIFEEKKDSNLLASVTLEEVTSPDILIKSHNGPIGQTDKTLNLEKMQSPILFPEPFDPDPETPLPVTRD